MQETGHIGIETYKFIFSL